MKRTFMCCPLMLLLSCGLWGQTVLQPAPGATAPVLTITPNPSGSSGDLLDIFCTAGAPSPCFQFKADTSFVFTGNTVSYGSEDQASASHIDLYGGTPTQAYVREYSANINPPTLDPLSIETSGGALGSGHYCFKITYANTSGTPSGETTGSNEQCIDISTGTQNRIDITHPTNPHGNAFGYQVYYSATSGQEQLVVAGVQKCVLAPQTYNGNAVCDVNADSSWGNLIQTGITVPSANTTGATFSGYWYMSSAAPIPCFSSSAPLTGDCVPISVTAHDNQIITSHVDGSGRPDFLSAGTGATLNIACATTPLVMVIGGAYQVCSTDTNLTLATPAGSSTPEYIYAARGSAGPVFGKTTIAPVYSYTAPTCPASVGNVAPSLANPCLWFDLSTNLMKEAIMPSGTYTALFPAIVVGVADVTTTPTIDGVLCEPFRLGPYRRRALFGTSEDGQLTATTNQTLDGMKYYSALTVNGATISPTQFSTSATSSAQGFVILVSQNPVLIINNGSIIAVGAGRSGPAGGSGAGSPGTAGSCGGAGGGGGGAASAGGTGGGRTAQGIAVNGGAGGGAGAVGSAGSAAFPGGGSFSASGKFFPQQYLFCIGGSGGAGSGNGTLSGAAGGASGGTVYLLTPSVNIASGSSVKSDGSVVNATNTNTGGGGGGGGGIAIVETLFATGSGIVSALGGAGGSGNGTGKNGGAGGDGIGKIVLLQ